MGLEMPESKLLPSSLVTVWPAWVIFVQVTVVPTLMVSVAGLKAKLPLLSVVMVTAWLLPAGVVAVGVVPVGVVPVGVVPVAGVGVEPEPVVVPPQAAKRTSALSASRTSHTLRGCEKIDKGRTLLCIVFPFLQVLRFDLEKMLRVTVDLELVCL